MERTIPSRGVSPLAAGLAVLLLVPLTGCIGLVANLIHAGQGHFVPATFDGLHQRKVAVICVSSSSSFGPSAVSTALAKQVNRLLAQNVPGITVIEQRQIEDWIDRNNWDQFDFAAAGNGVDAEMVVAIELGSFTWHEGQTMYKGRADVTVSVFDLASGGKKVFEHTPPQMQFPAVSGHHTTDISEVEFRRKFVGIVANRVARQFYAYDLKDDFAQDTTLFAH